MPAAIALVFTTARSGPAAPSKMQRESLDPVRAPAGPVTGVHALGYNVLRAKIVGGRKQADGIGGLRIAKPDRDSSDCPGLNNLLPRLRSAILAPASAAQSASMLLSNCRVRCHGGELSPNLGDGLIGQAAATLG
jgi:hypothetical protein